MPARFASDVRFPALGAVAGLVIGVVVLASASGCGGGSAGAPATKAASASPSASHDSARAEAVRKALAAYNGFRKAYVAASATDDYKSPDLAKYAGSPLLTQARLALQSQADQGIVTTGRPTWSPSVTDVNLSKRPYSVSISDCFDQSNWKSVYKKTGKSAAAPSQRQRYIIISKAELYDDGRWLISTSTADRSRTC